MSNPSLSIIIPTHKRAAILRQCLARLEKQTIAEQLEVIVVSDGPDEETAKVFEVSSLPAGQAGYKFQVTSYFEIPKSQQGVARNRGVEKATAPIILFIGDDAFLDFDACEKHLEAHHSQFSIFHSQFIAVLGFTTWDPSLTITPVMKWLEKTGWQFGYPMIQQYAHTFIPRPLQHRFTYTINISVPREVAMHHPFREDVTLYGWEDMLWGQELEKAGIPLYYQPDAKALHHHPVTMQDSLKRMRTLGESLVHLTKTSPNLNRMPTGVKLWIYKTIALLPTMRGRHYKAFLEGISTVQA